MKSMLRRVLVVLSVAVAAAWISGCVIHAEGGHDHSTPVKERHGDSGTVRHAKPPAEAATDEAAPEPAPVKRASDEAPKPEPTHNPPPPPPPK